MNATTASKIEHEGVEDWPTPDRFEEAKRALTAAYNALESLTHEYRVLNGKFDPRDIAAESAPVTAASIADVVEFVTGTELELEQIAREHREISGWPGLMAHVRLEQRFQARQEASDDA